MAGVKQKSGKRRGNPLAQPKEPRVHPKEKTMTKHYCDMCGKEIDEYERVQVTIAYSEEVRGWEDTDEEYDLCAKCAGKLRDVIIEGDICQQ